MPSSIFTHSLLQIDLEGNEGEAPFVGLPFQGADLPLMDQEFPFPQGIVIEEVPMVVGRYLKADEPEFAVLHPGIGVGRRRTYRFSRTSLPYPAG